MRNQKEVREEVLSRGGRYQVVPAASPLKVKEVRVDGRRYIVCFNENQAKEGRCGQGGHYCRLERSSSKEPNP